MNNEVLRFVLMLLIVIAGMSCLIYAKLSFAKRQRINPDNKWSKNEQIWRIAGYGLCIIDIIIAGFFN